ncbi:hypothetical protein CR513_26382, partial [Mucuna pruriens]
EHIDNNLIPSKFRELVIDLFCSSQDPHWTNDLLSCKLFLGTLRGVAMRWFLGMPPRFVTSFADLTAAFESHFMTNKTKCLEVANLFDIKQSKTKTLSSI